MQNFLSPTELARRLAVTTKTLRCWRLENKGPAWVQFTSEHGRGRYRYGEADLDTWLMSLRADSGEQVAE